jgi:hypothetical protein
MTKTHAILHRQQKQTLHSLEILKSESLYCGIILRIRYFSGDIWFMLPGMFFMPSPSELRM